MVTQDRHAPVIAVLGLGEAGSLIASDLVAVGVRVRGYHPAVTAAEPVIDTASEADAARGANLFAVEAYTFDRPIRYHLDYQALRAHLAEIHAERVVLTHMSTAMLSRLADAELPAAYDGMVIDL